MMRLACAAPNCLMRTYDFSKEQDKLVKNNYAVSFHKLPLDASHRSAWIAAAEKPDWSPVEDAFLCSLHFGDDCFDQSNKLYDHAVPTIFFEDFRSHIKNLAKEIDLEVNLESSDENEDILSKSLKSIGSLVSDDTDDGDQIVECEISISDDDDSGGTQSTENSEKKIFTFSQTTKTKTVPEESIEKSEELVSTPSATLKNTPKSTSILPAINIAQSTKITNSNDVVEKLYAMVQNDSLKKSLLVEPEKKEFVFQLLKIVKMANLQNASIDSSVPNTYLITTRQDKNTEDQTQNVTSMETGEIISLVTGTVKMIKKGEFRKSDKLTIICASPAIFLIKNVTVKSFDSNMNSVYVVTSDNLIQPLALINDKIGKCQATKSTESTLSIGPTLESSAGCLKIKNDVTTTKTLPQNEVKCTLGQNNSKLPKSNSNTTLLRPLKPKPAAVTNSQNDTNVFKNVKIDLKAIKTDNSTVSQTLKNLNLTGVPTLLQNVGLTKRNVLKLNIAAPLPSALVSGPNKSNVIRLNLASPIAVPKSAVYCAENAKTDSPISDSKDSMMKKVEPPAAKKTAIDPAIYLKNQQRDIERLEKDIIYHEREIGLMRKRVQVLKKRYLMVKNPSETKSDEQVVEDILNKYLDQDAVQFFLSQMKVAGKTYTQFRWSEEDKLFALGLLYKHPVEYNILFQKFTLPSDKTLSKFVSKIKKAENKKP